MKLLWGILLVYFKLIYIFISALYFCLSQISRVLYQDYVFVKIRLSCKFCQNLILSGTCIAKLDHIAKRTPKNCGMWRDLFSSLVYDARLLARLKITLDHSSLILYQYSPWLQCFPFCSNCSILLESIDWEERSYEMTQAWSNPTGIYVLKVNNRNIKTRSEICSKVTIKKPERHQ